MKAVFFLLLFVSWEVQGQIVDFDKGQYTIGSTVKIKASYADKESQLPIKVVGDLSAHIDRTIQTDQSLSMGKIAAPGFYTLGVSFDTIARFYHLMAIPNRGNGEVILLERPAFPLNLPAGAVMGILHGFSAAIAANDTLPAFNALKPCLWMISFKVFSDENNSGILTVSEGSFSGDCAPARDFLVAVAGRVLTKGDPLTKLIQALIKTNSYTPAGNLDFPIAGFTQYAELLNKQDKKTTILAYVTPDTISLLFQVL